MTNLMIWESMRAGTLFLGIGSSSARKMCVPAQLRDPGLVKMLALECAPRTFEVAQYVRPSSGCVVT